MNKYYFAVDDQKFFKAKKVNGVLTLKEDIEYDKNKYGFHYRDVSKRFVADPAVAIFNIILIDPIESNNKEKRQYIIDNITYDENEKCFVFYEYLTLGTEQWPKPCQLQKFENGEYEFIAIKHEIQILTSEICDANMNIFN